MRPATRRSRWRIAAAGALMLLSVAGCSDEQPPGESVPALATRLDKVDDAIERGDLDQARKAVDELVAETAQALVADDITDEEASRIIDAAREVLAGLPEAEESGDD